MRSGVAAGAGVGSDVGEGALDVGPAGGGEALAGGAASANAARLFSASPPWAEVLGEQGVE